MNELKRDYWSDTLDCITGKVNIDRREIVAIVCSNALEELEIEMLDIHLKSGTIFTVKQWDTTTKAHLLLEESPSEGVGVIKHESVESYIIGASIDRDEMCKQAGKKTPIRGLYSANPLMIKCGCGKAGDEGVKPIHPCECGVCGGWY